MNEEKATCYKKMMKDVDIIMKKIKSFEGI